MAGVPLAADLDALVGIFGLQFALRLERNARRCGADALYLQPVLIRTIAAGGDKAGLDNADWAKSMATNACDEVLRDISTSFGNISKSAIVPTGLRNSLVADPAFLPLRGIHAGLQATVAPRLVLIAYPAFRFAPGLVLRSLG